MVWDYQKTHGIWYATLQLHGPAGSDGGLIRDPLVGSPQMTWETSSSAFYDKFVPWCVREESFLRFQSLRLGTMRFLSIRFISTS